MCPIVTDLIRRTQTSDQGIYIFTVNKNADNDNIFFRTDRPKEITRLTLCVWVFIDDSSTSSATVVLFGTKLRVKIYLEEDSRFGVSFYGWNRYVLLAFYLGFGRPLT